MSGRPSGTTVSASATNRLIDGSGPFASANPEILAQDPSQGQLTLGTLGPTYPQSSGRRGGTAAQATDRISLRGNLGFPVDSSGYANDAAALENRGYADRAFGRVAYGGDGEMWLQYWLYYYFDDQTYFGASAHESDWELVQIRISEGGTPDKAAYAQHGAGEVCNWDTQVETDSGRPIVYVAQGSHASYFHPGHYEHPGTSDDNADGEGDPGNPTVERVSEAAPAWRQWPGRWGDSGSNSPFGPGHGGNADKWSDPSAWAASPDLSNCRSN